MISEQYRPIVSTLQSLGLVESEIQVFFAGLERGAATVRQLSEDTRLGRITVHEILKRLIKKGLFLETHSGKKRLVYPNQLEAVQNLLDSKRLELKHLEQQAQQATSLLKWIVSQSENLPKTRFYKGKEWVQIVTNEIKQDKKDACILSDGQHFYDLIDNDFLETSLDIRKRYKLTIRMIFPSGFEYFHYTQGAYQQQLAIKALPEGDAAILGLKWWLIIRGDKVAWCCYEGKFITTTLIQNMQIAQIMLYLYNHLWEVAKPY